MYRVTNLVLMGLYAVTLIIGIVFSTSILTNISTALAIFTFIFVQNQEQRKTPDEREKLIIERASSISFQIILSLLLVLSVAADFFDFLAYVKLYEFLSIFAGLGFMTFVSMYEYYQVKF